MMRWILIVIATLAARVAAVYGIGAMLPRTHSASLEGIVARSPAEIAATIRDVSDYPSWRPGVVISDIAQSEGATTYVEQNGEDRISYRLTEPRQGEQFVATITDSALPFGGAWTIDLVPEGVATRVRIREDGEIRDPLYRFFAHFVFDYTSSMESYLTGLGATDVSTAPERQH